MGLSGISRRVDTRYTPHMKNGRWQSVMRPGQKRVKRSNYRGWKIEIIDRLMGITIKRRSFAAVAKSEHPPFHFYRGFLRSEKSANEVVHRFVDEWHEEFGHLMSKENVTSMRRKRMAKKLFKIRHKFSTDKR